MAGRFNPYTARWETDNPARSINRVLSTQLAEPDTVNPADLVVGRDPRRPYGAPMLGTTDTVTLPEVNPAPSELGSAPNAIPLAPPQELTPAERQRAAENERKMGLDQPPGLSSLPDIERGSAPAAGAAPPPGGAGDVVPPAPARRSGGGGTSAVARQPGTETAQEMIARGQSEVAQDDQEAALRAGGDVEARKESAIARQAEDQAKAVADAQDAWQKKRDAAEKHLQEREDAASKMKVSDIFEGRPGAALAAALAAGIGARAAAITGTENTALRVLETGARAFRERQEAMYQREMGGIKNEQDRLQFASLQAAADEAGLYRRFEMDRTKLLKSFGADEARVKTDGQIADFRAKQAAIKEQRATTLYERGRSEVLQAAQISQMRASASHASAEAEKTRAETVAIQEGRGPGQGEGRAAAAQMTNARLAEHGEAQIQIIDEVQGKGVRLTKSDLAKIQDNRSKMKAAEHSSLAGTVAGRAVGVIPRGPYDGLSADKQRLASAYDILAQKAAAIASPSHAADEIEQVRGQFALSPNDDPKLMEQKLEQGRSIVGAAKALGGKYTERAATGAAQERAKAPAGPVSQADLARQIAGAQMWLRDHPDDGEVKAQLQRLIAQRRGG